MQAVSFTQHISRLFAYCYIQPILNIGFDTSSHAHPLPVRPSPQALEEQRVRTLIAHQSLAVNLHGLPYERAATVSDILTPRIRRSPFHDEVTANHLDLTECWRGLSHSQATELTMWYHFFHECLQAEVRASLCEDVVQGLLQSEEAVDEVYLVARILDHLRSNSQRVIDVSFVDLIDSMMGLFHDQFPNEAASVASTWSQFSGGLSLFLHNFLRVQDCFLDSPSGSCLEVNFDFQYADTILTATGNVAWQPPNVRFLHLTSSRFTGEPYRITPFISKEAHSPVSSPGYDEYIDQVHYTLPRSSLSFRWNSMKQRFEAIVPNYADGKPRTVETVLKATIITPFPDDVKFERQSRWIIKLDVKPAEDNGKLSFTHIENKPLNQADFSKHNFWIQPVYAFRDPFCTELWGSERGTVVRKTSGNRSDSPSPQKRKVSKPEVVDAALDTKRIRRELDDEAENDEEKRAPQFGDALYHTCSPNESPRTWYRQLEQHDSGTSSPNTPLAGSESSAPKSAVDLGYDALQQQQILRNYQEFADRKLFKDAGLISPVSDGERRVFESIFLEDSEEWSAVTDGSMVNFDTVMGEI
ncbi:hypothetical protein BU25DRAFT_459416 [Macroventuria anomochaeta]|uniref:Uncharacterized protein n=1 Tax=Macroventuria anomochaeta TaxID=301207 RepID=A0ACB6RXH9_9PLEO|nr:uncharacterized protein BU25DRAFT_459416 [Macroventuria anomochaeta]KAF2626735.1 hypothetical protein BU25DRAFT_459416 [Macroventuria anomochaeta]